MNIFDFDFGDTEVVEIPFAPVRRLATEPVVIHATLPVDIDPPEAWVHESTLPYRHRRTRLILDLP